MRFGIPDIVMKKFFIPILVCIATLSCKQNQEMSEFLSPEEGLNVPVGQTVALKLKTGSEFDSIQYLVDTALVASRKDTSALSLPTNNLALGARLLVAKVFKDGKAEELTTNIMLLPSTAPVRYSYKVVNTYPHDTASYTQGLEFHDGIFYESDGGYADLGGSSLRKVDVKTGKVLKEIKLPDNVFAEGITVVDDKLIQLTWQNGVGFVYDKSSFEKLKEFPYQASREGWGLCFDGQKILKSDGTNKIYTLNKDTYQEEGYIEVYDTKGAVNHLNELEFIDGKIYANVYETDRIVIIDPKTGVVEGDLVLADIAPYDDRFETGFVLNGIAWDPKGKRLFVTGKKWNKLFEIKLNKGI